MGEFCLFQVFATQKREATIKLLPWSAKAQSLKI
mgnify:CR=1 FL=1